MSETLSPEDAARREIADATAELRRSFREAQRIEEDADRAFMRAKAESDKAFRPVDKATLAGRRPTERQAERLATAYRQEDAAYSALVNASVRVRAARERLAYLQSPVALREATERRREVADFSARMAEKRQRDRGERPERGPTMAAVLTELLRELGPVHCRELTRVATERGLLSSRSASPERVVYSVMAHAPDSFRRVAPGVFEPVAQN